MSDNIEIVNNQIQIESESIGGFDEFRIINKDYFNSLEGIYKCGICFKIMDNPTDCETCGHSFCYECIKNLKCPFKCKNKSLKPSSQNLKDILNKLQFKCKNKDCEEIILYPDVKRHDKICEFQEIICPNNGCNKKLIKKNLENHVINECLFSIVKCKFCGYSFNKNDIANHENSCSLVNNSLKNGDDNNKDITDNNINKINADEYLKLLSMNVSKIVKENQELINNNYNINKNLNINEETKNEKEENSNKAKPKMEFSQIDFRPSTYAQIDEEELLSLITSGVEEELNKYFLDFEKNFMKLSKDIKDIKENLNKSQFNDIKDLNPPSKDEMKNIIEKTENNINKTMTELNEKLLEKLKLIGNKLDESIKKMGNNTLTNQQKIIIENINNSIDVIIGNINETKSKIYNLSNELHKKTSEIVSDKSKTNSSIDELNKNIICSLEKNSKDNLSNISKLIDDKLNQNNINIFNDKNINITKDENDEKNIKEEIDKIDTTLNTIKSNIKLVIKTITEEFADLTELITEKNNKDEIIEYSKLEVKEDKIQSLNINSLHKFSFGVESPSYLNNIKKAPPKLSIQNIKNLSLDNHVNNSETPLKFNSSFNSDNNENNTIKQNDELIISISNLENRMKNLENFAKNVESEIKQNIANQFELQVNNFNSKIETNLDNKINKMFSLKYCKECEKVDYFYGFKKCASCEEENCKQCINLCLNCKLLFCKNCCSCPKCNKNYCISCRILCTGCNKNYCKNCMINCSTCNKLLCFFCIKQCSICKVCNCGAYCSKTCYICNKNICNKCISVSNNILNCSSCNNNICEECKNSCGMCKKSNCKNCLKSCNNCNLKICSSCFGECAECNKFFCKKCNDNIEKICDLCNKIFCKECEKEFSNCFLCNKNICKNCSGKCLCGTNYCNLCSLECEKCGRKACNSCSAKCICGIAFFCKNCLKQNDEAVLMHDCLYFINDISIFDKKKTRSKLSFNNNENIEIKLYITNISKLSKLLIGLTDNNSFEENSEKDISNIYVINIINGKKFCSETNLEESFLDMSTFKDENLSVKIMIKNKQLFFKINEGEFKHAFDLIKNEYWVYIDKINSENNINNSNHNNSNNNTNSELISDDFNLNASKIKFIYAIKI